MDRVDRGARGQRARRARVAASRGVRAYLRDRSTLEDLMGQRGLSGAALARAAGCSAAMVGHLRTGVRGTREIPVTRDLAERVAGALQVGVGLLWEDLDPTAEGAEGAA